MRMPDLPLPAERHCALFDTTIGPCGLAWRGEALSHVVLPAADREMTLQTLSWLSGAHLLPAPWPPFVAAAMSGMQALLRGEAADLAGLALDWSGIGAFERLVYEAARRLEPGETCTYGELAERIGSPGAARAVGVALGGNPWPLVVPCHRVLGAGGQLGGFSAPGGVATKKQILLIEARLGRGQRELF